MKTKTFALEELPSTGVILEGPGLEDEDFVDDEEVVNQWRSKLKKYTGKKNENIVTKMAKPKMQRKVIKFTLFDLSIKVSSCPIQLYNPQKPEIIRGGGADYDLQLGLALSISAEEVLRFDYYLRQTVHSNFVFLNIIMFDLLRRGRGRRRSIYPRLENKFLLAISWYLMRLMKRIELMTCQRPKCDRQFIS